MFYLGDWYGFGGDLGGVVYCGDGCCFGFGLIVEGVEIEE